MTKNQPPSVWFPNFSVELTYKFFSVLIRKYMKTWYLFYGSIEYILVIGGFSVIFSTICVFVRSKCHIHPNASMYTISCCYFLVSIRKFGGIFFMSIREATIISTAFIDTFHELFYFVFRSVLRRTPSII